MQRVRRWFYVLTPILAVVFTLGAIEIGLSWLHPVPHSVERNMYFEADPYTGYRLRPGGHGHFQNGIPADANSRGHRDDEVTLPKPTGVLRILVLGDSFTVGANVERAEAYPQVLERMLQRFSERRVEVVNTGVGGWDPLQYAEYFDHYGRSFEADLVIVGFFVGNDTYSQADSVDELPTALLGRRITRQAAASRWTRLKIVLYEHSNLARLVLDRGARAHDLRRRHCSDFSEDHLAIQQSRLHNHLRQSARSEPLARGSVDQLRRIARDAAPAPVLVVLLPDENQINPALPARLVAPEERELYDFDMPQTMLAEMLERAGLEVIDPLNDFRSHPNCVYMNDTHWTPEGHRLVAEALYERVRPMLGAVR